MATLSIPYSFIDATAIVASEMNVNFGAVKTFVEDLSAGTNIDSGAITSDKLANATIQFLSPTGVVSPFAGSAAPAGWLLCDGAAVSRITYATLFGLVGTTYGAGDGTTTFNLPNLKGRVPVGRDSAQTEFDVLGETGGAKTHSLSINQLPAHQHSIDHDHTSFTITGGTHNHTFQNADNAPYNVINGADAPGLLVVSYTTTNVGGDGGHSHTVDVPAFTGTSAPVGTGAAHNILQPYIVLNYIIKA